eukprot:g2498.t1
MARSGVLCAAFAVGAYYFMQTKVDLASLRGQRVIVTGSSKGIGAETALLYCQHGARVVLTARGEEQLRAVAQRCRDMSPDAEAYAVVSDLSTEEGCRVFAAAAVDRLGGGLDVLVLNHVAGMYKRWGQIGEPLPLIRRLLDVNYLSFVYLAEYTRAALARSSGSIVVVSSLAGRVGLPKVAPYAATKRALHGFFESLRHDFESDGVGVGITLAVLGNIDTAVARKTTGPELDFLHWHSPRDAARAIIHGATGHARTVYFPALELRFMTLLDAIAPDAAYALLRTVIPP